MSLYRTRGVRPLLLAEVVSSLGSQMTFLALPLGLLIVGPLLQEIGVYRVFLVIAAGQTLASAVFAVAAFRQPPQAVENLWESSPTPTTSV